MIGASAALIGIGGGLLSNMIMTFHGRAIHQAVATSSGVGVLVSVPGALGYMAAGWDRIGLPPFSIGFVSLIGVALMAPVASFIAIFGVRVAHALPRRQLEIAFGVFLLAVSVRFAVSLIP